MSQKENIVTSEQVAPRRGRPKKIEVSTQNKEQDIKKLESMSEGEKQIVYFESGSGYLMPNGFKFTRQNPMLELPVEDAARLLKLENFRLPSDEEKQMYYNSLED